MQIKVRGLEMTYEDTGGTGTPLLLIHGYPLDHTLWQAPWKALAPAARVIAPDLRGFGETPLPRGPVSMETYADDLLGLIDALHIDRAVIGGLSMGGYITFAFYRQHASRVRALVLADTRPQADLEGGKKGRDESIALARKEGATAIADAMLPKLLTPRTLATRREVTQAAHAMMARQPVEGIVAALVAMRNRPDSTGTLAAINVPTLVLVGAEDTLTTPQDAETMRAGIRGARLATIPDAAHLSNYEQPEGFNAALGEFLKGV